MEKSAEKNLRTYLKKITASLDRGDATEHTHRPALQELIEFLGDKITATNEPQHVSGNAPDFRVTRASRKSNLTIGYIETKDVGRSLDDAEKSDQLKRYLNAFPNLILTDYLEFRWYVDGEKRETVRLASYDGNKRLSVEPGAEERAAALLDAYLVHDSLSIRRPKDLAVRMAKIAHLIHDSIVEVFEADKASELLVNWKEAFTKTLIPDLTVEQFANMFAQTLAYGFFSARVMDLTPEDFSIREAQELIPKTNPFLRRFFYEITGPDFEDAPFRYYVEDLVQVLLHTDIPEVLKNFGKRTRREDPVVHFYETFLAEYDPKLRKSRGVYYTPEPVVSYIVRSVDHLLKERFECREGLADESRIEFTYEREYHDKKKGAQCETVTESSPRVLVLDPACGTGTFLYSVVDHIRALHKERGEAGLWSDYVREQLLKRLFGFELLMAPYSVAHFKLGLQLAGQDLPEEERARWAYDFKKDDRLGVFLTNTLDEAEHQSASLFGPWKTITEEANEAAKIKRDLPIMVVMGNPPYSGLSSNMGKWIDELLKGRLSDGTKTHSYYEVDGKPLGEKKVWLQDDYVKFIRFGQWRIEQSGSGVLAFITNHGYLDNPTFRGMRQSLMETFSEIYVLDLHGNTKKKEKAPDGSADKNVFDIMQGVAVGIFVKRPKKEGPARVYHAELWGGRKEKYEWLFENDVKTTAFKELSPNKPFYFFVEKDEEGREEYEKGWKITDVFPVNTTGIVTARDGFVIDFEKEVLLDRICKFRDPKNSDEEIRRRYFKGKGSSKYSAGDSRGWKLPEARKQVQEDAQWQERITSCLYRPFDARPIYYVPWMVDWPRPEVMRHMMAGKNLGLISSRGVEVDRIYDQVFCTRELIQHHTLSIKEVNTLFPLYLYPDTEELNLAQSRRPNIHPEFIRDLESRLNLQFIPDGNGDLAQTVGPEDIFHYIYALFHAPTYRSRYAEFLKTDFPRVPLTTNLELFRALSAKGAELVSLHLLESDTLNNNKNLPAFPEPGSNTVEKPRYDAERQRIHINKTQYFENISENVWDFQVGGYQVGAKWLKDRKDRTLSRDEVQHYRRTLRALSETIRLMNEIETLIPHWPLQ